MTNYYRRFIPNFAKISIPFIRLTRKNTPFNWNNDCTTSFNNLKKSLSSKNILAFPNFNKPFDISTDASNEALGAVLSQENRPIAFGSKTLNPTETKYSTIEKELLGVVCGVKRFRCYVYGRDFTVFTDHKPLLGIHKMKDPSSRLLRLYLKLSEYNITLEYKPGKHNIIADGLSRLPSEINVITRAQAKRIESDQIKNSDLNSNWVEITKSQNASSNNFQIDSSLEDVSDDAPHIQEFYNRQPPILVKNQKIIKTLLKRYHDQKLGGHQGSTKTYQRLKRFYTWSNMKKDIEQYVRSCNLCQLNKSGKAKKMKLILVTPSNFPFEKIYLDIVGPLPITENGNKYILSIMDDLSRYMNCYPLPNQEVTTVTQTFITQVLGNLRLQKLC